ncbi:dynein regulatory complex subunit 4 [Microdochium nivale]|nr:dynein regulatory complex subunit 4 [Microdochium nivale]
MSSTEYAALANSVLRSSRRRSFDDGDIPNSRTRFNADGIAGIRASSEPILASAFALKDTAQASTAADEDADVILPGSRQISPLDDGQPESALRDAPGPSTESRPILSHAPRSSGLAAAAYLAGDEIFDCEDDDAMNYYQLDSLDDVRRLHSSNFTPEIDIRGFIRADMTREDWVQTFEGLRGYVDQRTTLSIQAAVVQALMAPALNERIRDVIYDMQDRGQIPLPSARRRAQSPEQNPASPRQTLQQALNDALVRIEHDQEIEDLERSHEISLRQLRDAHEASMQQLRDTHEASMQQMRDALEAATRATLARMEPRPYSRKRAFDPEEFGRVVKRQRSL